jgi:S1-C subfamily serine protease
MAELFLLWEPSAMTSLATFSDNTAELLARVRPAVVGVSSRAGPLCSGAIWRSQVIVTSEQALGHDEVLTVTLDDGVETTATVVGRDPTTNTAVLRIDRANAPAVELGDAAAIAPGHIAVAVGRHRTGPPLCALGTVALAGETWHSMAGGKIDRLIRLDIRPAGEIEGAPVFDAAGRVFGMVAAGPRRSMLAIPASTVTRAVDQLVAKGRIVRGYLGVGVQLTRLAEEQGRRRRALLVISVAPNGPAARAGMTVGDILLNVDDTEVRTSYDLLWLLGPESVGKPMVAKGLRGGVAFEWRFEVGERPAA